MSRSRRKPRARAGAARYAAPVAFLLAVTVAVLLIRSGLHGDDTTTTTHSGPVTTAPTTGKPHSTTNVRTQTTGAQFYTVQAGDTFGSISAKTGVSVSELERLNPGVSSNSLQVGQRLRVK
jgi:LysM repeat protein